HVLPQIHIFGRRVESDTGVMRGTTAQHLGTRVSHKRVAVFLGLNRVIPVQARLQQLWPAVEAQDDIEVGVGGAGFNQGNRNLGVFTQPGSHDGSGRATTDYQIVVVRLVQILLHSCVLVSVL